MLREQTLEASLIFFPTLHQINEKSSKVYLTINRFWLFFIFPNNITLVQVTIISCLESCKFMLAPLQMILDKDQRPLAWLTKSFGIWPLASSLSTHFLRILPCGLCFACTGLLAASWTPQSRCLLWGFSYTILSASNTLLLELCVGLLLTPVWSLLRSHFQRKDFSGSIIYKNTCLTLYPLNLIFSLSSLKLYVSSNHLLMISFPYYICSLRINYLLGSVLQPSIWNNSWHYREPQ